MKFFPSGMKRDRGCFGDEVNWKVFFSFGVESIPPSALVNENKMNKEEKNEA